jgi:co-chaperonin GroES (HSP10)
MLKIPANKLLVTIEKKYQDNEGGFYIDPSYRPEDYATIKGIVHSIPDTVEKNHYRGDIEQLVKVGDEIYFNYGIIYSYTRYEKDETPLYKNMLVYNGEEYWKVDYGEVFCIVRDGKILMPTQHVLLAPVMDVRDYTTAGGISMMQADIIDKEKARIVAMPKMDASVKVGDIVPVEPRYMQEYIIFDTLHYISPVRRIIAKY